MEPQKIREWVTYQRLDRHSARLKQQELDENFFTDTYTIPLIKDTRYQVRTGFVANMLNGITQQVVSNKPRVFTLPKTKGRQEAADRIASFGNKVLKKLARYPDNPLELSFKRNFMGEAWIYTPHVTEAAVDFEAWAEENPNMLPVHFIQYDPTVVFSEPTEEVDGIPMRVAVYFPMMVSELKTKYPKWTNPKNARERDKVMFTLYFQKDYSYAEADEEPLFRKANGQFLNGEGQRDNPYKLVPFVHALSGWGIQTKNHDPDLLAYSRVRMIREKIVEVSTMDSDFQRNIHEYAWKHRVVKVPQGTTYDPQKAFANYSSDPDAISVVELPKGGEFGVEETQVFDAATFQYWDRKKGDLLTEYPLPLQGAAVGGSGRHQDIAREAGLELYDCCLQNVANMWAKALDFGFEIAEKMDMRPTGIQKGDCDSYEELTVDLEKRSATELTRRSSEGDLKYQAGVISLESNLVEYQGKTKEEAKVEIAKMFAFSVMRDHPFFKDMIARMVADEQGVGDQFQQFMAQMGGAESGVNPPVDAGARGGPPRNGNIQSLSGLQAADLNTAENRVRPGLG